MKGGSLYLNVSLYVKAYSHRTNAIFVALLFAFAGCERTLKSFSTCQLLPLLSLE